MKVSIISLSDVHGYIRADDFRKPTVAKAFGLSRAAKAIKEYQQGSKADEVSFVIENGDFIQGSPFATYIRQVMPAEVPVFQHFADDVQADFRVLGNHEFNFGRDYLEAAYKDDTRLLNANVIDQKTGQPFIGKPYEIVERAGLKFAFIGLTTKYVPKWELAEHITNLMFLDPVQVAQKLVAELRSKVDAIIVAYHGGFAENLQSGLAEEPLTGENQAYQLLQIAGIDVLVTGHQHREIATVVNQVAVTQPGYRASHLGLAQLDFDDKTKVATHAQLIKTSGFSEDVDVLADYQKYQVGLDEWLDEPLGTVDDKLAIKNHFLARIKSHPFVEFINQVQLWALRNSPYHDTKIAGTAIFSDEIQGLSGAVTYRDILTNYLFLNTVVVERLTGAELKAALERSAEYFALRTDGKVVVSPDFLEPKVQHYNYDIYSGIDYTIDLAKPKHKRVTINRLAGEHFDPAAKYLVAVSNYRGVGAGEYPMFQADKILFESTADMPSLIRDYIKATGRITAKPVTNLKVKGYLWMDFEK